MKIFDDHDNEVPRGTVGQIVVRGPQVMKGYVRQLWSQYSRVLCVVSSVPRVLGRSWGVAQTLSHLPHATSDERARAGGRSAACALALVGEALTVLVAGTGGFQRRLPRRSRAGGCTPRMAGR